MSEPISNSAEDRQVGPPERLHPLFLLTGMGRRLRGLAGGYVAIAYLAARGQLSTALIGAVAILGISLVALFLYWRRFEYRVGANEIRVDSGIFSRTHRSIPFDRIQDVDITQGPVARLLGLAKVKFETGGSAAEGDEGVLQAIALERAEELRQTVRSRQGAALAEAADLPPESRPVFAMNLQRLMLAGFFNFSLAVFAGLIGLTQTAGDLVGFDPLSRAFWTSALSEIGPLSDFVLANRAVSIIAGLSTLVLVGIATGIVRTVLRDFRFRLDRVATGLRRRRGLLTLTDVTLPVRRAQAALILTGPVRERFGWRELKLQSLARDEGGSGDHVLAPLAKVSEVGEVLEQLGWPPMPSKVEWRRVSGAYVWVLAIGLTPLLLLGIGQAIFVSPWGWVAIAVIGAALATRWVAWTRTCYALDGDRLLVRTGWWRRRTLILPIRRIQSIDIAQSFVSRWFGVCTMLFGVAGGSGFSAHSIPALPEKNARDIRDRLLSPGA